MKKLTRRHLAASVAKATGLSQTAADNMTAFVFEHMTLVLAKALKKNDHAVLILRNFGSFRVHTPSTPFGWDFRAGAPLAGPPRRRLTFRASRYFKDLLQDY